MYGGTLFVLVLDFLLRQQSYQDRQNFFTPTGETIVVTGSSQQPSTNNVTPEAQQQPVSISMKFLYFEILQGFCILTDNSLMFYIF